MLLAVDIGNSNIKFGIFDGDTLLSKFQIPTNKVDQLDAIMGDRLDHSIANAIVCSVVPAVEGRISEYISTATGVMPEFVRNDWDLELTVNYDPLVSLGTDRLVNAAAAAIKYDVPFIVCSFGTAVTMDFETWQSLRISSEPLLGIRWAKAANAATVSSKLWKQSK